MIGRVAAVWLSWVMVFGCAVFIVEITEPVGAITITVDDSGGANFFTITMALNAANDGDTVYVYSGTYYEHVVIDKSINLTGEDKETTIIDAQGVGDVVHISAHWVNVSGFTIKDSGPNGMLTDAGIDVDYAHNVTISDNKFTENHDAIYLDYSNNSIVSNNIFDDFRGIDVFHSTNITILDNTISTQYEGIDLGYSILCKILNNTMIDTGFEFSGWYLDQWTTHEIDTSNTVNGNPVYYWKNQTAGTIPLDAGQVILANCTNVIVENQHISETNIGLILGHSYNNFIKNNNISSNEEDGLHFFRSYSNIIEGNTFIENQEGIAFYLSNGNNISDNIFMDNAGGMIMASSERNDLFDNLFSNNIFGLMLVLSNENIIHRNNCTYNWAGAGIHISSSSNNSIFNNILIENMEGINITDFFYNSSYNEVFHNSFIGNTD